MSNSLNSESDAFAQLQISAGTSRVVNVRRVFYETNGEIDRDEGPVELAFSDGNIYLLSAAGDGYSLDVNTGAWENPFHPPLSDENTAWVAEHGNWSAVQPLPAQPEHMLIGDNLRSVDPIVENGRRIGVAISGYRVFIEVRCDADETRVVARK